MSDLTTWLPGRLDEEERVIREAAEDYFYADGHGPAVNRWLEYWRPDSPDRMLAEVEAKRRIMAEHVIDFKLSAYAQSCGQGLTFGCTVCHDWDGVTRGDGYCATWKALAQPYAWRPGWREEWRS